MRTTTLKRGQIKMFESIAMLLVFFFLVAIGLKFYGAVQLTSLEETKEKFKTLDSIKMAILLANLPEIKCSIQNVQGGACVDLFKLQSLASNINDDPNIQARYNAFFGSATIRLNRPLVTPADQWMDIYDNTPTTDDYSSIRTPLPVTVWNPWDNTYEFGVLEVNVHS